MVRRFVHNQQIGARQNNLQDGQPGLFAAGQVADRLEHVVAAKLEPAQHLAGPVLGQGAAVNQLVQHPHRIVQFLEFLGVVTDPRPRAELHPTLQRLQFAEQQPQHRGFSGAVGPQKSHFFPTAQQERDFFKYRRRAVAAAHTDEFRHPFRDFLAVRKEKLHGLANFRPFQTLQPVQLGLPSPGLLGLDAGFVTPDIFFGFGDFFLLLLIGGKRRFQSFRLLSDIPGVTGGIFL